MKYISLIFCIFLSFLGCNQSFSKNMVENYGTLCFVTQNGELKCHDDEFGLLSLYFNKDYHEKTAIIPLDEKIIDLDKSSSDICVITVNKQVKCWGSNGYGQLGNGKSYTQIDEKFSKIDNLENIVNISVGNNHVCALDSFGKAKCWGYNEYGQLGNGTFQDSLIPVNVKIDEKITKIVIGLHTTCALLENGLIKCWGLNNLGQLGDGTKKSSSTPVIVKDLIDVKDIDLGLNSSCALTKNNLVKCWGLNNLGQLGMDVFVEDGDLQSKVQYSTVPVEIKHFDDNIKRISIGDVFSCVLSDKGNVECWGAIIHFSTISLKKTFLSEENISTKPVELKELNSSVKDITAKNTLCVLTNENTIKCLDSNIDSIDNIESFKFSFKEIVKY